MYIKNKNILIISPEHWNHIFVSKHHYATHLAERGNKVFYLNPPSNKIGFIETEFSNMFSVNYSGFLKGLRFYPSFARKLLFRRKFQEIQNLCGVQFDIVWSFDNSVFFDFSALPKEVYCISHIVDLNQDFEFEMAAKTADLCLGVIPKIVDKLKSYNNKSFIITHGVKLFEIKENQIKLPGEKRIKALYAGNLEMKHINWELIYKLIDEFNDVDFIFIGDRHDEFNDEYKFMASKLKNTFFMPKVNSKELPYYLNAADILLLAYKPTYDFDCALPHKLFEYLQTGKNVVSNWIDSYSEIISNVDITVSKSDVEYIENFRSIKHKLSINRDQSINTKNIKFAVSNSYENQIEKIENLIIQN